MDIKGGKQYSQSELHTFISQQPVRLYPSFLSKVFLFLIALTFVALGLWMIHMGYYQNDFVFLFIGALSVVFFGPIGVLMIKKFSSGRPTLEINREGFYDHQNLNGQFIAWKEVSSVITYKQNHNTFLGIALKDPEQTLTNLSAFKRWGMKSNRKLGFPDLVYLQALLGGQKSEEVAKSVSIFIK